MVDTRVLLPHRRRRHRHGIVVVVPLRRHLHDELPPLYGAAGVVAGGGERAARSTAARCHARRKGGGGGFYGTTFMSHVRRADHSGNTVRKGNDVAITDFSAVPIFSTNPVVGGFYFGQADNPFAPSTTRGAQR